MPQPLCPLRDLLLCAKHLFVAAMVDGSALRADGLIADEADRFDATKAGHWGGHMASYIARRKFLAACRRRGRMTTGGARAAGRVRIRRIASL